MWQASQQMQCVMLSLLGSFWKFNTWSLAMAIIVCLNTALVLLALIFLINIISWFSSSQEPWLISMLTFHAILLLVTIISRRNINFQLILSALTCEFHFLTTFFSLTFSIIVPLYSSNLIIFFSSSAVTIYQFRTSCQHKHWVLIFLYWPVITETSHFLHIMLCCCIKICKISSMILFASSCQNKNILWTYISTC